MTESGLLPLAECRRIFDCALSAARRLGADDLEITLGASSSALTRFANNTIHQNVSERHRFLSARTVVGGRTARAGVNRLDDASVRTAVEQSFAITRASEPDPEMLPMAEAAQAVAVDRYRETTARSTPHERAETVAESIDIVERAGQTAAGICSTGESVEAILNSRGVCAYHFDTMAQFSITAIGPDSSGWAKATAADRSDIDPLALARSASEKALRSRDPRELPPGEYTVILEPSAVQDLVGQMFFDFGATAVRDQRSFLTGRVGAPLFGAGIQIVDDVHHPLQTGAPFDGEGVPRQRLKLVENGVPREIAYSREAAHKEGRAPTGHGFALPNEYGEAPMNIVIAGGDQSLEQMIASTRRGVLVTRVWYIREVDPYEKIMTGMTRDGTFLIEDGEVRCGLRNFRFNQSLIEMLKRVEAMSPPVRASGEESFDMVAPAMKVGGFHFTEVTKY